jgi:mono/diheme cytochrome c family protein
MKRLLLYVCLLAFGFLSACKKDESQPAIETTRSEGIEYAPQMYHSIPYEPYTQLERNPLNPRGLNTRHPADHTIARGTRNGGWPYGQYDASSPNRWAENYEKSADDIKMPDTIPANKYTLAKGKQLYTTYCDHCHGAKGEGGGPIFTEDQIGAVSYKDAARIDLPPGKMYYSITYGKGAMGSHASQLTPEERWLLVHYVRYLQDRQPQAQVEIADLEAIKFMQLGEMNNRSSDTTGSEEAPADTSQTPAREASRSKYNTSEERQASNMMPR